jgi:hypothetical protein
MLEISVVAVSQVVPRPKHEMEFGRSTTALPPVLQVRSAGSPEFTVSDAAEKLSVVPPEAQGGVELSEHTAIAVFAAGAAG